MDTLIKEDEAGVETQRVESECDEANAITTRKRKTDSARVLHTPQTRVSDSSVLHLSHGRHARPPFTRLRKAPSTPHAPASASVFAPHKPKTMNGHASPSPGRSQHRVPDRSRGPPSFPGRPVLRVKQQAAQPLPIRSDPWARSTELKFQLRRLPKTWGTLEVYKTFAHFGKLIRIELFEPRSDDTINGYVIFRPPPAYTSTLCGPMNVKHRSGVVVRIECMPDQRRDESTIPSPTTPGREFPQRINIPMTQLDIGVMEREDCMLALHTSREGHAALLELEVDLQRKKLELNFPVVIPRSLENEPISEGTFKVEMDFSQIRRIAKVDEPAGSALILEMKMPPLLFGQTRAVDATHESSTTVWNEHQTWLRQTGVLDKTLVAHSATQLHMRQSVVDIGRWLTYRMVFDKASVSSPKFLTLGQALVDHNLDVAGLQRFQVVESDGEMMWQWSDPRDAGQTADDASSLLSEMQQTAAPISRLEFSVRYQLEVCISQGCLHEVNMTCAFIERLAAMEPPRATRLLEKVTDSKERYQDPMTIFRLQGQIGSKLKRVARHCTSIPSAVVTPTTIYFAAPVVESSNRVVRHFRQHEDRFLRVKFTDERYKGRVLQDDRGTQNEIFARIKRTMTNGIKIGDRLYEFLAFGNSQFREHGAYFFASTGTMTAGKIRQWMGDFTTIRVVAKYASRLGQCFSTTRPMSIGVNIERIPDIERNGFTFTDGVGKISPFLAQMIAEEFGLPKTTSDFPSVFQFRLGGCKGVLAVDPQLRGQVVSIRPSQEKFPATYRGLEICRTSQHSAAYLNMQIILVLSALGVPDWVFLTKMRALLVDLGHAMTDSDKAQQALQKNVDFNQMSLTLASMVHDFMDVEEPFVKSCLHLWRSWMIKYLKEKARILVDQGTFVLGCVDETGILRGHFNATENPPGSDAVGDEASLPQIFLQIPDPNIKGTYQVTKGICVLTRSPTLHPGDVRVVKAVDVPELHHLKNCVVLPQTGDRDLANMCCGGDLDGDDYLVLWDVDLLPKEWNCLPMDYKAPRPGVNDGPVTVDDMTSFFVAHMKNDNLSRIAVAHKYWADAEPDCVKDEKCIELAHLHSMAVDFAKTGVPAIMPKRLQVKRWPHWAEPKGKAKDKIYHSKKVLGQLYDEVQRLPFTPAWDAPFDRRILDAFELEEQTLQDAREMKLQYDEAVRRVMAQFGVQSEFEVWTTFALDHSSEFGDWKFAETIGEAVATLKQYHQELCYERAGTTAKERDRAKMDPFVAAMYTVTRDEVAAARAECREMRIVGGRQVAVREMTIESMPFMSFPWLFLHDLARTATKRPGSFPDPRPIVLAPMKKLPMKEKYASLLGDDFELPQLPTVNLGEDTVHGGDLLELFPTTGQDVVSVTKSGEVDSAATAVTTAIDGSVACAPAGSVLKPSEPRGKAETTAVVAAASAAKHDVEEDECEEVVIDRDDTPSALSALAKLVGLDESST